RARLHRVAGKTPPDPAAARKPFRSYCALQSAPPDQQTNCGQSQNVRPAQSGRARQQSPSDPYRSPADAPGAIKNSVSAGYDRRGQRFHQRKAVGISDQGVNSFVKKHSDMGRFSHDGSYNESDSISSGNSSSAGSFKSATQLSSLHNSSFFPWPTSISFLSRLAYSRNVGGTRMRPLPSTSSNVAYPIMMRLTRCAALLNLGKASVCGNNSSHSGSG